MTTSLPFFAAGRLGEVRSPFTPFARPCAIEDASLYVHEGETRLVLAVRRIAERDLPDPALEPPVPNEEVVAGIVESPEWLLSRVFGEVQLAGFSYPRHEHDRFAKLVLRRANGEVVMVRGSHLRGVCSAMELALRRARLFRRAPLRKLSPNRTRIHLAGCVGGLSGLALHTGGLVTWVELRAQAMSPGARVRLHFAADEHIEDRPLLGLDLVRDCAGTPELRIRLGDAQ
jgi:hypothetical protein